MGKIVKYCSSCDEGFAERFGFCPDCGAPLQAFEMNPVSGEMVKETDPPVSAFDPMVEPAGPTDEVFESPSHLATEAEEPETEDEALVVDDGYEAEPIVEEPEDILPVTAAGSYESEPAAPAFISEPEPEPVHTPSYAAAPLPDDDFHVTVIDDRNGKTRNGLLLGATAFMVIVLLSGTVYSIFNKSYSIGSIGDDDLFAMIPTVDPDMVEIEKPEVEKKDKSGGGGGGGNEDPEPAAKGKPPAMMDKPDIAPDVNMTRLQTPTLTQRVGVQGPTQPKVDPYSRYGMLNGLDNDSNGPGSGTGIGTGRGGGVGSGNDSGLGTGSGGGAGGGNNGGIGDGDGRNGGVPPPPSRPAGVTQKVKIISKPKAPYTDAARQNNVQGSVTLKIVFLASGQVGPVTAISRLPYGLTENAIAAAKQIRFEPAKRDGVPYTTSMTFQYGFNIY